jgi:hypothetical protein
MPHRPGCRHCADVVTPYREARRVAELDCEATCKGYATEHRDFPDHPPLPTFRSWLEHSRRPLEHGRIAYSHGCRCQQCRAGQRDYMRAWRAARSAPRYLEEQAS